MLHRRASRAPRNGRRRRIRKLRLFAVVLALGLLALSAFTFGLLEAVATEIPSLDPARRPQVERNGYIYASDGKTVLAVLRGSESRVLVGYDDISPWMKHSIVAIEDRRFWDHNGIDLRGILRAAWADIRHKQVLEGGSTIVQQFVKNAYLADERSFARKVREAALSWQLSQRWSKPRILTAYLNTIYFGNGAYGVQQAAKVYFDEDAAGLTLPQAALLAGIPADPTAYDPVRHPAAARARRAEVLKALRDEEIITPAEEREANRAPLPDPEDVRLPGTQGKAPYFSDYAKQQLDDAFGSQSVYGEGLQVRTTIDLGLQELARKAVWNQLHNPDGPSAALVALDPTTGDVLAMVGGRTYSKSQFNLAVQSRRQPGSAFKPFVLASALQDGISPATHFTSEPITIFLGDRYWSPSNYEDVYLGDVDLVNATIHSDNVVYAQLTNLVGPKTVARTARRLGIRSPLHPVYSIGLGTQAVNPVEMARAFSAFANGGYRIDTRTFGNRPRVIDEVRTPSGKVLARNDQVARKVLSPRTAAWMNEILQDVVSSGTGQRAALTGWPVAGKTGTTEDYGDAWFVGYTPQLVTAVWVGYPAGLRPMLTEFGGEPVAGGTLPAMIWKRFMERALPYLHKEPEAFPPPPSEYGAAEWVVQRDGRIQRDNGLCTSRHLVVYFPGSGPSGTADCKENEVEVPNLLGAKVRNAKRQLALVPLTPKVVYRHAFPGEPAGVVVEQRPHRGRLSSYGRVVLVVGRR
ncbi:MAG TPA: PBP1A family penicillin-binding protein [Gaiellaceae bacterium]|nr:PBP1A family penicillin-binding protein [Gaiellaceae bacterium]